jgi:hypothetical protein
VGVPRSIMREPTGAVPLIILDMPMSPSVTVTVLPGSDLGAEQVNRE